MSPNKRVNWPKQIAIYRGSLVSIVSQSTFSFLADSAPESNDDSLAGLGRNEPAEKMVGPF